MVSQLSSIYMSRTSLIGLLVDLCFLFASLNSFDPKIKVSSGVGMARGVRVARRYWVVEYKPKAV